MNTIFLYNSRSEYNKFPFGAVREGEYINIKAQVAENYSVALILRSDNGEYTQKYFLNKIGTKYEYNIVETSFFVEKKGLYYYRFEVYFENNIIFFGRDEAANATSGDYLPEWQLTVYDKNFKTPKLYNGGIMYQIFPDRFKKADIKILRKPKATRKIREDWGGEPDFIYNTENYNATDFFMGNIEGIIESLDYLKQLSVDIIYLNPIFDAASNHRYNTGDYFNVDCFLGENSDFKRLCKKCEQIGIKVILDGVFSHTGDDSVYFNKYNNYDSQGAYNSDNSPYKSWYSFNGSRDNYDCWWGFKTLPNVNETDESYIEFITGKKGVLNFWQKKGAHGFRLDVVDEIPDVFLERLRKSVKEQDENALIIGEVWEDASNKTSYGSRREFLLGEQLDTVMNYVWRAAILRLLADIDIDRFINSIIDICENYPKPSLDCMMNLLSTHDTERMITILGLDTQSMPAPENHGKFRLTAEQYSKGKQLLELAATILYFLPGIPCIYYGDEIGMQGLRDPYNRGCFENKDIDEGLLQHFKTLGEIRSRNKQIFSGNFSIEKSKNLLKLIRTTNDTTMECYINLTEKGQKLELSNMIYSKGYFEKMLEPRGFIIGY